MHYVLLGLIPVYFSILSIIVYGWYTFNTKVVEDLIQNLSDFDAFISNLDERQICSFGDYAARKGQLPMTGILCAWHIRCNGKGQRIPKYTKGARLLTEYYNALSVR